MKNKMLKRSHLSEKTCREIIQLFSDDLTATQIAAITNVSRVTINNYLKLIRTHIARHCEEHAPGFYTKNNMPASSQTIHVAGAEDAQVFYGFYKVNGNIFTDELQGVDKSGIRELQQAKLNRQEMGGFAGLDKYHAIADFDEWRLYRTDSGYMVAGHNSQDEIAVFWSNTRSRLLKFRGMNKNTLYLHVKESEFRYNNRGDDINKLLLNIIYKFPLHLSRNYV